MKIKFKNGTTFEYLEASETEEYYNGYNRRTLTFECSNNAISIDELNTILSDENQTKDITLINEEMAITHIHSGYVLKLKCGIERMLIESETPETPAKYEDRIIFKLGKRTYIEEQLVRLNLN